MPALTLDGSVCLNSSRQSRLGQKKSRPIALTVHYSAVQGGSKSADSASLGRLRTQARDSSPKQLTSYGIF